MYWHSSPQPDRSVKDRLNTTMEAVREGAFKARVFFDRITQQQLEDLIWIISLGENKRDSLMQYKLGHAKPLGYGSVKLTIEKCTVRTVSNDFSISLSEHMIPPKPGCSFGESPAMRSILKMCDQRTTAGKPVEYLYKVNERRGEEHIYLWFQENRKNAKYLNTLPEPTDPDLTLPTSRLRAVHHASSGQANLNRSDPAQASRPNYSKKPTDADFIAVKDLYPVGKKTEAEVSNVTKDGNRVFFRLQGTPCNASAKVLFGQSFERDRVFLVRVTGYYEPNKTVSVKVIKELG